MWLILCSAGDVDGAWCAVALRRCGLEPVEVVLAEELVAGSTIDHRIVDGVPVTSLRLRDGRIIDGDEVAGVVNRLSMLPSRNDLGSGDRSYVTAERIAATVSWLAGLECEVLNRPLAHSLSGRWLRTPEWQLLAQLVGLRTAGWSVSSSAEVAPWEASSTALVIGQQVIWRGPGGDVDETPSVLDEGLVALAAAAGLGMIEVQMLETPQGAVLLDAQPMPQLRPYGERAALALAEHLSKRSVSALGAMR